MKLCCIPVEAFIGFVQHVVADSTPLHGLREIYPYALSFPVDVELYELFIVGAKIVTWAIIETWAINNNSRW